MTSTGRVFLAVCGCALLFSIPAMAITIGAVPAASYNGIAQTDGIFQYLTAPGSVTNTSGSDSDTVMMSAGGPLISSTAILSGSGNGLVIGENTLTYYVEFSGPSGNLPIDIAATGSVSSSLGWNYNSLVAGLTLSASQPTGPNYNDLASLVCNYEASEFCSGSPQTLNVDSPFTFAANVPIAISMFEEVGGSSSLSGTVTGSLDPILSIDPSFANAGAYTVEVSAGITQSLGTPLTPANAPEPGTWALLAGAMGAFALRYKGWARRRP
jgi:hypothetical protein